MSVLVGYGSKRPRTGIKTVPRRKRTFTVQRGLGRGSHEMQPLKQQLYYGDITFSAADTNKAYFFQPDQLGNFAAFQALYDEYRVTRYQINLIPCTNPVIFGGTSTTNTTYPPPVGVIDYDDANTLVSNDQYCQYDSMKIAEFGKTFTMSCTPRIAIGAYAGFTSGYSSKAMQWCSTQQQVQHYGIKVLIPGSLYVGGIGVTSFKVLGRVWIQFRNMK